MEALAVQIREEVEMVAQSKHDMMESFSSQHIQDEGNCAVH